MGVTHSLRGPCSFCVAYLCLKHIKINSRKLLWLVLDVTLGLALSGFRTFRLGSEAGWSGRCWQAGFLFCVCWGQLIVTESGDPPCSDSPHPALQPWSFSSLALMWGAQWGAQWGVQWLCSAGLASAGWVGWSRWEKGHKRVRTITSPSISNSDLDGYLFLPQ